MKTESEEEFELLCKLFRNDWTFNTVKKSPWWMAMNIMAIHELSVKLKRPIPKEIKNKINEIKRDIRIKRKLSESQMKTLGTSKKTIRKLRRPPKI